MSEIIKTTNLEESDIAKILISTNDNLKVLAKLTSETAKNVETMSGTLREHSEELQQLKYNEEITDQQSGYIRELAKSKVNDLVGVKSPYYGKFMSDIYRYLKKYHFMGSKINTTTKGNYDSVIEGIKNYNPDVKKIKAQHDEYLKEKEKYAKSLLKED